MSDDIHPGTSFPAMNENSGNNLNPSISVNSSSQNFNSMSLNKMNLEESSVEVGLSRTAFV
jgi:hypothetical protein